MGTVASNPIKRPKVDNAMTVNEHPSTVVIDATPRTPPVATPCHMAAIAAPAPVATDVAMMQPFVQLTPLPVDARRKSSGPFKMSADVAKLLGYWNPENTKKAIPVHTGGVVLKSHMKDV